MSFAVVLQMHFCEYQCISGYDNINYLGKKENSLPENFWNAWLFLHLLLLLNLRIDK